MPRNILEDNVSSQMQDLTAEELLSKNQQVESLRINEDEIASSLMSEPATLSNAVMSKDGPGSHLAVGETMSGTDQKENSSLTVPVLNNTRKGKRYDQGMPARSPIKIHNAVAQFQQKKIVITSFQRQDPFVSVTSNATTTCNETKTSLAPTIAAPRPSLHGDYMKKS